MKLSDLKRVKQPQPKPVEKKVCLACRSFEAVCEVPMGEGAAPMCWLCAHHVVDHGVPLHEAMTAQCECHPMAIYPDRTFRLEHGDIDYSQPRHPDDWKSGHFFNPNNGCMETNVRGKVVDSVPLLAPVRKNTRRN